MRDLCKPNHYRRAEQPFLARPIRASGSIGPRLGLNQCVHSHCVQQTGNGNEAGAGGDMEDLEEKCGVAPKRRQIELTTAKPLEP